MAFGWSFPKLLILLVLAFYLLGVPLMSLITIVRDRLKKEKRNE